MVCADQAEVDHYWVALSADGGEESVCGWLKDKYGFSWQVVPSMLRTLPPGDAAKDRAGARRRSGAGPRRLDSRPRRAGRESAASCPRGRGGVVA